MILLKWIFIFLCADYCCFMLFCLYGWKKIKQEKIFERNFKTKVSVIIPARNEALTISECLHDILRQNFPHEFLQVIVIDDASEDETGEVVRKIFMNESGKIDCKLLRIEEENFINAYKKRAISKAMEQATGELIITTDADCTMNENWIASIVSLYEKSFPKMIAGPVAYKNENTFFEKIQSLEFAGLIGIGGACISNQTPVMCNGANLAYQKKIFLKTGGFDLKNENASGDDTRMMLKIASTDPASILFLKSNDAIVYTSAKNKLNDFWKQRRRWSSKIPNAGGAAAVVIAVFAYLFHLSIIVSLALSFTHPFFLQWFFIALISKSFFEFLFLFDVMNFFKRKKLLYLFLPAQLIYIFYIIIIGALVPFKKYEWKNRMVR